MAQLVCFLRNTKLVIDWHNFGYSILALKLGRSHPLVRISHLYERIFSQHAAAHFTVTNAMARILEEDLRFTAPILPLHDRPAAHFQPLQLQDKFGFLMRLPETAGHFDGLTRGTTRLLVSSTSWTPDEDFSVLVDALCAYSELATSSHPQLPEILAIITGKGPLRASYLAKIASLKDKGKMEMVTVKTAWLIPEDYAALLASADLGVSLHTSSSGVDLPMKVVDMFGAGLPVVGFDRFKAWPELVTEGVNGRGFGDSRELVDTLVELFGGDGHHLERLQAGALGESKRRWADEWDPIAGKLFELV